MTTHSLAHIPAGKFGPAQSISGTSESDQEEPEMANRWKTGYGRVSVKKKAKKRAAKKRAAKKKGKKKK